MAVVHTETDTNIQTAKQRKAVLQTEMRQSQKQGMAVTHTERQTNIQADKQTQN